MTIRADRADEVVTQAFLEKWGDDHLYEAVVTVDATDVDVAERARDAAQAALMATSRPRTSWLPRWPAQALEEALARPVVRRREVVATDTYAKQWAEADTPARAAMLKRATEDVRVEKSTGPTWDPSRIAITWRDEVE